jgi:hypothetical protein
VARPPTPLAGLSIVLTGSFNPAIFQPSWYAAQKLIGTTEAENAVIGVIHPQITQFGTDDFQLQVTPNQFAAWTLKESFHEGLRDLVVGTFKILEHTPLLQIGVNHDVHFQTPSEKAWHSFGHQLAPKEFWNPILSSPGLMSMTIRGTRPDELKGHIDVRVEPSLRIPVGVYVLINDNFDLPTDQLGVRSAPSLLVEQWPSIIKRASSVLDHVGERV